MALDLEKYYMANFILELGLESVQLQYPESEGNFLSSPGYPNQQGSRYTPKLGCGWLFQIAAIIESSSRNNVVGNLD